MVSKRIVVFFVKMWPFKNHLFIALNPIFQFSNPVSTLEIAFFIFYENITGFITDIKKTAFLIF